MPEHYSSFGEAAGAAMAHNARTAARRTVERAAEEQTAEAPRNALDAPQTAEPPAPGPEQHPGGENGPHTGTQDRAAGAPHTADEERRQRYAEAVDQAPEARAVRRAMAVADAEQRDVMTMLRAERQQADGIITGLRARLEERTRQLGEVRTRTTELEARVNGELADAEQRVHELENAAREADRLRRDWTTMRDRAEQAETALARGLALCDDADRRGITSGPPLTADRIRAALAPQAGDDTTGDTP